ncbi:MAG: ATP-binding protein [Bradymonadaceae bacterium]
MNIQSKILLGILPVVAGAIVIVGVVSLRLSTGRLREQVRRNTTSMSSGYADELNTRLINHRREIESLAAEIAAGADPAETFRTESAYYPTIEHLVYADADSGRVKAVHPSRDGLTLRKLSARTYWSRASRRGESTISTVNSDFGYRAVVVSAPVTGGDGGPAHGVVSATLATDVLFEDLNRVVIGELGEVAVIGRQGDLLNPKTCANPERKRLQRALQADDDRLSTRITSSNSGWVSYEHGSETRFLAFARVPVTEWRIAVHGRLSDFTGGIERLRMLLVLILGASIVVTTGFVYVGVRTTVEPIRELTNLIERVQEGDLDVEFDVDTDDEIARLGEAFNDMTDELHAHRDRLEERVDERTQQVEAINEELRREVEERREAERAFRESEARYRTIVEQCVEGIYLADPDSWELVDANPAFFDILGYDEDDLSDLTIADIAVLSDEEIEESVDEIIGEGMLAAREGEWRCADGTTVDVRITASYIEEGGRDLIFVIGRDITEQKRIQSQLELTNRLASLGTLAAGIAHEINNPLSYIVTNLYFLEEEIGRLERGGAFPEEADTDELVDVIEQSKRGADRVQNIVDDLRSFYRSDNREIVDVELRRVLESIVALASSDLPDNVEIVEDYEPTPPVEANEGALKQVFLNIVVNAIQALPEERRGRSDTIRVATREEAGEVAVEVTDTGTGIAPEHRDRIFDPFFTTKSVDEGTGLGLSMSLNIVKSFGGDIDIETEVGEGTTFIVTLPVSGTSDLSASSVPFA